MERLVFSMVAEDAAHLSDGLGILVGGVRGWHDEFALRSVEMAAPVGHDAVGAHGFRVVLVPAFATVAHDRVIRDAGCDRQLVDREHKAVVWREGVHAIRDVKGTYVSKRSIKVL